eukprot:5754136-Amphidinium_carterae.4
MPPHEHTVRITPVPVPPRVKGCASQTTLATRLRRLFMDNAALQFFNGGAARSASDRLLHLWGGNTWRH